MESLKEKSFLLWPRKNFALPKNWYLKNLDWNKFIIAFLLSFSQEKFSHVHNTIAEITQPLRPCSDDDEMENRVYYEFPRNIVDTFVVET